MEHLLPHRRPWRLTPPQTISLGFACMIFIGALLLNLPAASQSGQSVGFLNALFTATSANCVTGLIIAPTISQWTTFGKVVILILIQLGGLGFMTVLTIFLLLLKRQISLKNRIVIQSSFNLESIGGMVRLVRRVVLVTLACEGVGAVLLALSFLGSGMAPWPALYKGVFHAISAFCNAGFDTLSTNSLIPYQSNFPINFLIGALIVLGGLGFTVWDEMIAFFKNPKKHSLRIRIAHLSLHSKIVFIITGALIVGGAALFLLIEWRNPNTLGALPFWQKIQAALFQSVTLRTAGFNSISQDGLHETSQFLSCILMLIGGSSASTAGGMKTVTVGILLIAMLSGLRGRSRLEAFGRTLPLDLLQKALTVASAMLGVVLLATFLLHFTERNSAFTHTFLDLLYEVSSAAGTVGVTTGITPYLSDPGKIILIVCMFLGRLGPVTVVIALNMRMHAEADHITYPAERVIIG